MNRQTNICEKGNRLALCVHTVLKMMQCWQEKRPSHLILSQTTSVIDSTKQTEFADDSFMFFFFEMESLLQVENNVGKGEMARY